MAFAPACFACFKLSAACAKSRMSSSEAPDRIASRNETSEPPNRQTWRGEAEEGSESKLVP
jgi:hypothetical protein